MSERKKQILFINGPNINMIGIRQQDIYGLQTYSELISLAQNHADKLNLTLNIFQTNHEGEIVDKLQQQRDIVAGIIINPAAFSHSSIAILDALLLYDKNIPIIEVHISNIAEREKFRQNMITSLAATKIIMGKGINGYLEAIDYISNILN
jgi:3-dehydroquinate dehydratase II